MENSQISNRNRHPITSWTLRTLCSVLYPYLWAFPWNAPPRAHPTGPSRGGLLRRNMAPGPALVPEVVQWRNTQLTGGVKAALQTYEQSTVSGANCLPDVTFQPHSSRKLACDLIHNLHPIQVWGAINFTGSLAPYGWRRLERNSVLCITQIMRDVFRETSRKKS